MNRTDAKELHAAIQQAVRDTLATHGYEMTDSRMGFEAEENGGGNFRIKFAKESADSDVAVNVNTPEARAFVEMARAGLLTTLTGQPLSPDALGREVDYNGQTYVFAGYKTRAPKRPFVFKSKGGDGRGLVSPEGSMLLMQLV